MDYIDFKPFDLNIIAEIYDTLPSLHCEKNPVDILINGESLYTIIHKASGLENIFPAFTPFSARIYYENLKKDGKVYIFVCSCGVEGCDDIEVTIEFRGETVVWKDWERRSRPMSLRNFVFSLSQYQNFLKKLHSFINRPPVELELKQEKDKIFLKAKENFSPIKKLREDFLCIEERLCVKDVEIWVNFNNDVVLFSIQKGSRSFWKLRDWIEWETYYLPFIPGKYIFNNKVFENFWEIVAKQIYGINKKIK